ncbi:MAG: hypothetical protein M1828_001707 [Chrysothrix sp. TS-e1954]|nr:MAG: hypothetical protein M1828_001707 [Chrysothrix sp. TS-e1954]
MDVPVNVPVDDPNADTEWCVFFDHLVKGFAQCNFRNDILRKHGVIPEKPPSPTPMVEEALTEARRLAHEHRLEGKNLDELDELEDDEDEDFLERYRKQRLSELSTIQRSSIYGQVYPVQKPDYSRDVTEASSRSFVLVLLTSSLGANTESALMGNLWRDMAATFGDIKFCQMRAQLCIEGYPEKNTPTLLVYKDGDIQKQIVTLQEFRGEQTGLKDLEDLLVNLAAVHPNDTRLKRNTSGKREISEREGTRGTSSSSADDEYDSGWD